MSCVFSFLWLWVILDIAASTGQMSLDDELDGLLGTVTSLEDNLNRILKHQNWFNLKYGDLDRRTTLLHGGGCPDTIRDYRCRMAGRGLLDKCLPSYLVCDGVSDCPHGDDERVCDDITIYMTKGTKVNFETMYDTCSIYGLWRGADGHIADISVDPISNKQTFTMAWHLYRDQVVAYGEFKWTWYPQTATSFYNAGGNEGGVNWKLFIDPLDKSAMQQTAHHNYNDKICARNVWIVVDIPDNNSDI